MKMRFLILLFSMIAFAGPAAAADTYGCEAGPVRVGLAQIGVLNQDGVGADNELLSVMAEITGCALQIEHVRRSDGIARVKDGTLDMTTAASRQPEQEQFAWFVPYLAVRFVVLANRDTVPEVWRFEDLEAIEGIRFGRAKAARHGPYYDRHLDDLEAAGRTAQYPSFDSAIRGLLRGEVDATISVPMIFRQHLTPSDTKNTLRILYLSPAGPVFTNLMFGKHRFTAAQAANWHRLIEDLQVSGDHARILSRFMTEEEAESMVWARTK